MDIDPDEEPEDLQGRKVRRLAHLRRGRRDAWVVACFGLAMLAVGAGMVWFVVVSLQRGFIDLDDGPELLYASQEPVSFYLSSAFMAAMGLFSASLGVRMLLHGRREAGRAARRARRVAAVGTRRR